MHVKVCNIHDQREFPLSSLEILNGKRVLLYLHSQYPNATDMYLYDDLSVTIRIEGGSYEIVKPPHSNLTTSIFSKEEKELWF